MINENTKTEVINCATRHPHKNQTENNKEIISELQLTAPLHIKDIMRTI